jgi:hypothetical protein
VLKDTLKFALSAFIKGLCTAIAATLTSLAVSLGDEG